MRYNQQSTFGLPSTWLELNVRAEALLFTVTLLIGSVSLLAVASGEPETMALVALTGLAVVVLGTTLVRLSERLRTSR
ncbi:hypothetical protein [Natronobacterium texcoconense]|uniref:Uncharacterized protein n=1 Tax=Natronobacterium texcoconense TaxID=1095778 RepID=A0A1H1H3U2_NATTX|nr:hypothetical protein [Natronobacterium texcoconense]SDR20172.1 hypothetical protein SAMN04489842_2782 [Natronobacterium texcoconense]